MGLIGLAILGAIFVPGIVRSQLPTWLAVFILSVLALSVAAGVRRVMLGVYVSETGIRSRNAWRTVTLPWASVLDIRSGNADADTDRRAIVIEGTDGTVVRTPLQHGDILQQHQIRPEWTWLNLSREEYDEILETLREHHRRAQGGQRKAPERRSATAMPASTTITAAPSTRDKRTPAVRTGLTAAQRRHALVRQHERGALTDAEFAAELAKLNGEG
ncbi:PH domain-containing protein [Phytohabitans flavus]